MLNIAITAGGTSETIDGVRKLTNVSTGRLGWQCLEAVLQYLSASADSDFHVYYIHTETAFRSELADEAKQKVEFITVTDAASVYASVDDLTKSVDITHFIHSMAISDFTYSYGIGIGRLAQELHDQIVANPNISVQKIEAILTNPQSSYQTDTKISSKEPLLIGLETTRKVIPLIKNNNPNTFLVGFKLLRNATEADLMCEAARLTKQNGCDMVFANELSTISAGSGHTGLLIQNGEVVARPTGKDNIAETIVESMLKLKPQKK